MKTTIRLATLLIFTFSVSAQTVIFNVDMGVQAYKGLFNPSTDAVKIAGNFNGWNNGSDVLADLDGDTIYTITKTFTIGEELVFRFVKGTNGWEYFHNRKLMVPQGNSTFSAYFNNDSIYFIGPLNFIFECNMEYEIMLGRFSTPTDTLSVRGSFNGWTDGWTMSPTIDTNIYRITKTINTYAGEVLNYKFVYKTLTDTIWEFDPNKIYTVSAADVSNGTVYIRRPFNNISPEPNPYYPFKIKFTVDMNGAASCINHQLFSSITDVRICGVYNTNCWHPYYCWPGLGWPDSDSLIMTKLFDDGTNGDEIAGDNIWSKDVCFPSWNSLQIRYRYSANWGLETNNGGNNNEANEDNHIIFVTPNILSAKVANQFGIMGTHQITDLVVVDVESEQVTLPSSFKMEQNYPNPFNPSTKIRYTLPALTPSLSQRERVIIRVYDVLGNEIITLVDEFKSAGSYEVEFSAKGGLASGIYFYQMRVNDFVSTKKMILVR